MKNNDSKKLWLNLEKEYLHDETFTLGRYTTQAYFEDPSCLAFITSRYKFCSKILSGHDTVVEVGCGDGFGSAIVAQRVNNLICTDINNKQLKDNSKRMSHFKNIDYLYHDFRENPFESKVDAVYLIDVIEHIFEEEENNFMTNLASSLNKKGVCIIGTPNKAAEKYASKYSKEGHVNLKDYKNLIQLGKNYFESTNLFGMNDEVVHTGFPQMAHFLWLLCLNPKNKR